MASPIEELLKRKTKLDPLAITREQLTHYAPESTEYSYSANNLVEDKYFLPIAAYMKDRMGVDNIRGESRSNVINLFLNNMRGFSGGNSVRTVSEVRYLNSLEKDDPRLQRAGQAYKIFEGMSGLFSGDLSIGEAASNLGDYARTTIFDPINLLGGMVGRAVGSVGTKVAAKTATSMALRAAEKAIAKGASKEVAIRAADKTYSQFLKRAARLEAKKKLLRPTGLKALTTKAGLRNIVGVGAVDALAGMGADVGYQHGLIKTGVQDEYSALQTGLAGLTGLFMAGVTASRVSLKGTQDIPVPDLMVKFKGRHTTSEGAVNALRQTLSELKTIDSGDWAEKVLRGKSLKELDGEFWNKFLFGDKDLGIEGFGHKIYGEGYRWSKRNDDDKVSNFLSDVITAQGDSLAPFLKDLNKELGTKFSSQEFGDSFVKFMNRAGQDLNLGSKAEKLLRLGVDPSVENVLKDELRHVPGWVQKAGRWTADKQNGLIRLLVSHSATTMRNIRGWGDASVINSITDIVDGALYGGQYLITRDTKHLNLAKAKTLSQGMKFKALIDPEMSYEAFDSMTRLHEQQMSELSHTHVGGVKSISDLASISGVKIKDDVISLRKDYFEKYVDLANTVTGVKIQDRITKSIEFNYQMDKNLRIKFNMGMADFYSQPDVLKKIGTMDYAEALNNSILETQKSIFGKSYRKTPVVGKIAAFIEDFRKKPGLGLTMPFGRFFNNTVAFLSDHTGVSLFVKHMGVGNDRSSRELFIRSAVGMSIVYEFMKEDQKNLREDKPLMPISVLHMPESAGGRNIDVTSEFPIAPLKAIARSLAYRLTPGKEMSKEETEQVFNLISGQLTRNMTSASRAISDLSLSLIGGGDKEFRRDMARVLGSIPSQIVQDLTRPLDIVNEAVGLSLGDQATVNDRRQGHKALNDSLRYIDQIISGFGIQIGNPKFSATQGKLTRRPSGVLGSKEVEFTDTMKLLDSIGKPYYKLDSYSKSPKADNRWNQIFFDIMENKAGDLLNSRRYQSATQDQRVHDFDNLMKETREEVYDRMLNGMSVDDKRFAYQLKIGKAHSWEDIDKGLSRLGQDTSFEDLDLDQLKVFKYWLDNHDGIEDSIRGSQ